MIWPIWKSSLKAASGSRFKMIVTDGVFSMDGYVAQLDKICDLADKYDALVMVDECHATGFIGKTGKGTIELKNVIGRVDIITGTLGKALGGAMGGFTSGRKEIIDILRQRSRPYLFSNSLAPNIVGASLAVFNMLAGSTVLRDKLENNVNYFKKHIKAAGFDIKDGDSAIVPIMLYDAALSQQFADKLLKEGIYVIGFFFPVVPKGQARIRVQLSAAHETTHLDKAVAAFTKVGKGGGELGVILISLNALYLVFYGLILFEPKTTTMAQPYRFSTSGPSSFLYHSAGLRNLEALKAIVSP